MSLHIYNSQVGVTIADFRVIQALIEYSLPRLLGFDELLGGAPKLKLSNGQMNGAQGGHPQGQEAPMSM